MKVSLIFISIFFSFQLLYAQTPGTKKWEFVTGGQIESSPAIGPDGTIYVGSSDSSLYAINPIGTKKWEFETDGAVRSSPVIGSDGTIYVGSYDQKLYAINPDGIKEWEFKTGGLVYSSIAIGSEGTIYAGADNDSLYAINPNGTKKWAFHTGGYDAPSISIGLDGTAYAACGIDWPKNGQKLIAIAPNGTKKWEFKTNGDYESRSPAIGFDGTIYFGSGSGGYKFYAVNPDGTKKWEFAPSNYEDYSAPVIGPDGTVYLGSRGYNNNIYAFNPDGTKKWEFETNSGSTSSPAIGSNGIIYVGARNGKLYAINPDGSQKWGFTTGDFINSSPSIGEDGIIYIGSADNKLYAIYSGSDGLADSPWPKFGNNNQNQSSIFNENCPQAKVAQDNIFLPSGVITLDGSSSIDADGDPLNYLWRITEKPLESSISLSDSTSPVIDISISDYRGHYIFLLKVTDNDDGFSYAPVNVDCAKKWEFNTGGTIKSSPAIGSDGTIYIGSGALHSTGTLYEYLPDNNKLYAVNPDGSKKWEFEAGSAVESSPAIGADGTIYVGSFDSKLYAINPNGTKKWDFQANMDIISSPAIGSDGTVYFGSCRTHGKPLKNSEKHYFYAINPDGSTKWEYTTTGYGFFKSPAIGSNGTIYVSSGDTLFAIKPDGTKKWLFEKGGAIAVGSSDTVYLASEKLYKINPDGSKQWEFNTNHYFLQPAIGPDGTIFVGSDKFYALNPDGTIKWETTDSLSLSAPTIGFDGTVYGCFDSTLYAINPDGTKKWTFKTGDSGLSHPAINFDGSIYLGSSDNKLYAIHSESKGLANSPWPRFSHDNQNSGNFLHVTSIERQNIKKIPDDFVFYPLYPNPFNPSTQIKFSLPKAGKVEIDVYNVTGQFIGKLLNGKKKTGTFIINWDASNMATGMYFIRMKSGSSIKTRKCLLVK